MFLPGGGIWQTHCTQNAARNHVGSSPILATSFEVGMKEVKCLKCGSVMEEKAWLMFDVDEEGRGGEYLFQCPDCKNIEVV